MAPMEMAEVAPVGAAHDQAERVRQGGRHLLADPGSSRRDDGRDGCRDGELREGESPDGARLRQVQVPEVRARPGRRGAEADIHLGRHQEQEGGAMNTKDAAAKIAEDVRSEAGKTGADPKMVWGTYRVVEGLVRLCGATVEEARSAEFEVMGLVNGEICPD